MAESPQHQDLCGQSFTDSRLQSTNCTACVVCSTCSLLARAMSAYEKPLARPGEPCHQNTSEKNVHAPPKCDQKCRRAKFDEIRRKIEAKRRELSLGHFLFGSRAHSRSRAHGHQTPLGTPTTAPIPLPNLPRASSLAAGTRPHARPSPQRPCTGVSTSHRSSCRLSQSVSPSRVEIIDVLSA
jgi:hypothetical protein